jgi:hypothetical protein
LRPPAPLSEYPADRLDARDVDRRIPDPFRIIQDYIAVLIQKKNTVGEDRVSVGRSEGVALRTEIVIGQIDLAGYRYVVEPADIVFYDVVDIISDEVGEVQLPVQGLFDVLLDDIITRDAQGQKDDGYPCHDGQGNPFAQTSFLIDHATLYIK